MVTVPKLVDLTDLNLHMAAMIARVANQMASADRLLAMIMTKIIAKCRQ